MYKKSARHDGMMYKSTAQQNKYPVKVFTKRLQSDIINVVQQKPNNPT